MPYSHLLVVIIGPGTTSQIKWLRQCAAHFFQQRHHLFCASAQCGSMTESMPGRQIRRGAYEASSVPPVSPERGSRRLHPISPDRESPDRGARRLHPISPDWRYSCICFCKTTTLSPQHTCTSMTQSQKFQNAQRGVTEACPVTTRLCGNGRRMH